MPAATAAILARLWGAFAREPIPGVTSRHTHGGTLTVSLADGTVLAGDAAAARPFAQPRPGFVIDVTRPGAVTPERVTGPGALVRAVLPGPHAGRLAGELDDSVANLAVARAAQPAPDGGAPMLERVAAQPDPLAWLEQSVVDGHPLHPCARTRMGLTPDEVRAYAPEHRPIVRLRRVEVPADRWWSVHQPPVLLLHPWQHDRLRDEHPWLAAYEELPARPLMSLRTLASVARPNHHIKTSVDIQMTSAVRTVSPASIHNGYVLSDLLKELRVPGLGSAPEIGGGAVILGGGPDRRLAVAHRLLRDTPPGGVDAPLAALTAPAHASGAPLVTELVGRDPAVFVESLASVLLRAVLAALAAGVALEAHGQNMLATLRRDRLIRLTYRDFGGVRVSARRLKEHGIEVPPLLGDIPCDDPDVLRTKVFASAVTTVLGELIAVLGRAAGLDEQRAWHRVAAVARDLPGPDVAHLFADTLPVKATTAMRLAEHPVDDLWCHVPNPMAGLR